MSREVWKTITFNDHYNSARKEKTKITKKYFFSLLDFTWWHSAEKWEDFVPCFRIETSWDLTLLKWFEEWVKQRQPE